uniref:Microtubule-associated protein n=1 Tax=Caenorhabditis japonica TaxID=281687 RepID=A0A8R1I9Z2_CAEJA
MKNANHVAGGGNVQIESRKLDFSNASPKVGSKTNYTPAKSDVKIVSEKLAWNAKSKVGSMDNAAHKPTGGNVQVVSSEIAISRPSVTQVTARPKLAATMLESKGMKRRSMSQKSSSSGSLLQSKQFPGAIYPLSPDYIFR